MPQKPFDLSVTVRELQAETASPDARLRAHRAVTRRPRKTLRFLAVAGGLGLLLLPAVLRTRGSQAAALTLDGALAASIEAPYVILTMDKYDGKGKPTDDHTEHIWAPQRYVARLYFRNGVPGSETRHLPGLVFCRRIPPDGKRAHVDSGWKPYEFVVKTKEDKLGTESLPFLEMQRQTLGGLGPLKPFKSDERHAWFQIKPNQTWKVELDTDRLVSIEAKVEGALYVTRLEYPEHIDKSRLDVPPVGKLPRFDLTQERADMDRLIRQGDRTAVVKGRPVKLVGVFQELAAPKQPIYVLALAKGAARASGLTKGVPTPFRTQHSELVATIFPTEGLLRTLDVEIPVPGTNTYAEFKGVRVRPISDGIRNTLRMPLPE
ncbi:hypothetical protein EON81_12720 [bacterium]|nr:MAG: hypothetical protein EON81_12720 [bacterium]